MIQNLGALSSHEFRYETKLPLQREQYQEFTPALINLGLHPRKTYSDRQVNSIYIDTPNLDDYYASVSGISRRSKTRFRWYQDETVNMVLEVKRKKNKMSTKHLIRLENSEGVIPEDQYLFRSLVRKNKDQFPVDITGLCRPVLEVNYKRSYFEIKPEIRMTIDQEIRYRKLSPTVSRQLIRSLVDYVVEFKYPVGQEADFQQLLRNLPFRIFRHSKYVVGIDTVAVA